MTLLRSRTFWIVVAALVIIAAVAAWIMLPPRALGFAGGGSVALADYQGPNPAGAPPELASADLIARG